MAKKEFRSGWERETETWMGAAGMRDDAQRPPERIREDVCEALGDTVFDACAIDVQVEGGDVILTGSVPDEHTKRLVETAAARIGGVAQVRNELVVRAGSLH